MRCFVAVLPPPWVVDRVAHLPRPQRAGLRWTGPEQWHVTLRFLGEIDDPDPVEAALRAGPLPAADARLGPATAVLARRTLVVPVAGLDDLAAAVRAAVTPVLGPGEDRPYRGHLTLARRRRGGPGGLADLAGRSLEASFPVAGVALVRSHLGSGGARYEVLAEVDLAGERDRDEESAPDA